MSDVVKKVDPLHNTLTINREKYRDVCFKRWRQRMEDMKRYVDDPYHIL